MKKLMLTVMLGLATSAPAATVTLTTTAYVNGAPTSQKGLTTPSQTKVPGGAPVFCAVVPPDGMTVEGWAVVNADGSLTVLAGMAGKLSLVFTTTAAMKSVTVVAMLTDSSTKRDDDGKKKNGLILLLR